MRTIVEVGKFLHAAARAHARWDYDISMDILKNRRKLLLLLIMTVPILTVSVAFAAGQGDALPSFLGGKEAYNPAFYTDQIFLVSILVGLCAGLITGCIGAGGGFIITPALMSVGVKGILAVGTDLFHIFAKAMMGTAVHKKLGNVSMGLAIAFLAGSGIGVLGGGVINRTLYEINPILSDAFISLLYVVMLGFLGFFALIDFLRLRRQSEDVDAHGSESIVREDRSLASKLQAATIPPLIKFDHDLVPGGKQISGVFVAICGAVVGFVAAIMGVGGGFLTFPMFVYVLGVSSFTTVGTDIMQIIFTAGFASISQYAVYGFIFYTLAMGMLLGSLIGIQIGALTTKVVKGIYIRAFYAVAILAGFANRLFALPSKLKELDLIPLPATAAEVITTVGNVAFFVTINIFAVWVIGKFLTNLATLKGED